MAWASSTARSHSARSAVPDGVSHSSRRLCRTASRLRSSTASGARRWTILLMRRRSCPVVWVDAFSSAASWTRCATCSGRLSVRSLMTRALARSTRPASSAAPVSASGPVSCSARWTRAAEALLDREGGGDFFGHRIAGRQDPVVGVSVGLGTCAALGEFSDGGQFPGLRPGGLAAGRGRDLEKFIVGQIGQALFSTGQADGQLRARRKPLPAFPFTLNTNHYRGR